MPINAHPEYLSAEKKFHLAQTDEERLTALEEMVKTLPSHKGAETLRRQVKTRYKKLKEKLSKEKQKAKSRGKQQGIKKADMQAVLLGLTNSGKSSVLKALTNAKPIIAQYPYTTNVPLQAMIDHNGVQIQIIDLPPIGSEGFETNTINTADTILIVVDKIVDIPQIQKVLSKSKAKQIIVFNKSDLLNTNTSRKTRATLKSKRYNFELISTKNNEGIDELKEKVFKSFNKIRVYTKQPGIEKHDNEPVIMPPKSTIEEVAEKILHGFAKNIKKTRIWGPSSKFGGQVIGLKHVVKDLDVLEFTTK